jgi:hypothetical protein
MVLLLRSFLGWLVGIWRAREDLILENLALRQQLLALRAKRPRRRLGTLDKLFWVMLRTAWSGWKRSLIVVAPQTRGALAQSRLPDVLGLDITAPPSGRKKALAEGIARLGLPHGC